MLEQRCHVGLVAAHAVQRLGKHDLEFAALGVLQERLQARPKDHAGAGDGGVMIGANDFPLLPRRMFVADAELILDRGDTLVVGGIAGVERNPDHRVVSSRSVLAPFRRGIVVRCNQPLELLPRHLPADQAGDPQYRRIDAARCRGLPLSFAAGGCPSSAAQSSSSIIAALVQENSGRESDLGLRRYPVNGNIRLYQ